PGRSPSFPTRRSSDLVGLPAIWRQVKENLPFWAEKLPQMPNLLHQYLEQGPKQQRQLLQQLQHLAVQQRKTRQQIIAATFAAALDRKSTRLNSSHVKI